MFLRRGIERVSAIKLGGGRLYMYSRKQYKSASIVKLLAVAFPLLRASVLIGILQPNTIRRFQDTVTRCDID